jgi:hypothetical protein
MRNLNLGPDTKKLINKYRASEDDKSFVSDDMADMLERWMNEAWCWVDGGPARVCGGPHVKVRYKFDRTVEVIEPANKVGETYPEVEHAIIK